MRIKRIHILIPVALALLAAGCGKETLSGSDAGGTPVHIRASVSAAEAHTKALITGTAFPDQGTYGIFVCNHGSTSVAHKSNSWNIKAQYTQEGDTWAYYYVGNLSSGSVTSVPYDNIALTEKDGDITADLYAYAPYVQGAYAGGPEAIPYSIANIIWEQADLMYAQQNISSSNSNLNPRSESALSARVTFRHAFSLLAFKFKIRNMPTIYSLSKITVTLSGGASTAKLYSSGTFNAITGAFNDDGVEAPSISVSVVTLNDPLLITSTNTAATAYMMLVPTRVEDDELVFTFTVNDQTLQPFSLQKSHLLHSDGATYGFQSGYKYTFNFTLDNYIYFDGLTVSSDWTTETLGSQDI